jgi:hypothetical protein
MLLVCPSKQFLEVDNVNFVQGRTVRRHACRRVTMEYILYETSLTAYCVTSTNDRPLRGFLDNNPDAWASHVRALSNHFYTRRKQYEEEEEREKIGSLRDCRYTFLGATATQGEPHGFALELVYDKITYKFLFYSTETPGSKAQAKGKRKQGPADPPYLLLVKASAAITTRFFGWLAEHFKAAPVTITLNFSSPNFLPLVLSRYVASIVVGHTAIADEHSLLDFLRDTIGAMKLSVAVSDPEAEKSLRSIELDVPPETLFQLCSPNSSANSFIDDLRKHVHARTGLLLPFSDAAYAEDESTERFEPPLKLSRVSCGAFALSSMGRVKFSRKAVDAVDAVPSLGSGAENVVRRANQDLLERLMLEAKERARDVSD